MESKNDSNSETASINHTPRSDSTFLENPNDSLSQHKRLKQMDNFEFHDVEFGAKPILYFPYFTNLKDFFQLSTHDYFERCLAALYPYMCITLHPPLFMKTLKTFFRSISLESEESIIDLREVSKLGKSDTDDKTQIYLNNERDGNQSELNFDKNSEIEFNLLSNSNCYVDGIKLKRGSNLYRSLSSMTRYPDLYGPIWINIIASSSLFFSRCFSQRLESHNPLISLTSFFELIFLSLSCTFLMALCISCSNYFWTKELKFTTFVSFLCVCGYVQIPLALLCKVCILISLLMFFHPLHYLLLTLKVFTYFYLFLSTSCTLFISLPPLKSRKRDFKFKLASIISSYSTQVLFLTFLQKYIH